MKIFPILIAIVMMSQCKPGHELTQNSRAQAPLIIYKTRADYSNKIPVIMNDAKDKIIAYPAVSDVKPGGTKGRPAKLNGGFLLDNFGITPNTVYTSYTIREYSSLEKTPSLQELTDRIIDKDPFTEIYDCGSRSGFKTYGEINGMIRKRLGSCRRVK
jgi:hypothetical protein